MNKREADARIASGWLPFQPHLHQVWLPPPRSLLPEGRHRRSELLDRILLAVHHSPMTALLHGPVGCGKTTLVYDVARELGRPLWMTQGSQMPPPAALFAAPFDIAITEDGDSRRQEYQGTALLSAVVRGGIFFLDELAQTPEASLNVLHELLGNRTASWEDCEVGVHPEFTFIAAQNESIDILPTAIADRIETRFEVLPPERDLLLKWLRERVPSEQRLWLGAFDDVFPATDDPVRTTRRALSAMRYAIRSWQHAGSPRLDAAIARTHLEIARVYT
ncbi:MAG: hypothetical protein A3E25_12460 [Burkholderiales bacterium RIFCSPHIGHO2_12_FULL_69_20]|nr:MAG: hypothetical protein A3E25_12460 [Burkholderiales bacterium RIFCSPHIGHO2_12_FULL_69_20]